MGEHDKGIVRRIIDAAEGLMPDGPEDDGPPPDVDGRHSVEISHERAVSNVNRQRHPLHGGATSVRGPNEDSAGPE